MRIGSIQIGINQPLIRNDNILETIGVGKGKALPALRTVHAVLPHTALRSVVSSSGLARQNVGVIHGEEPSALAVHAGICTGVQDNRHSYRGQTIGIYQQCRPCMQLPSLFPNCGALGLGLHMDLRCFLIWVHVVSNWSLGVSFTKVRLKEKGSLVKRTSSQWVIDTFNNNFYLSHKFVGPCDRSSRNA